RILECPVECLGWQRTGPVGRAKQSEYGSVIEVLTVGGQAERAASDLDWDILHELTILGRSRLPNGSRLSCGALPSTWRCSDLLSSPLSPLPRLSFPRRRR